MVIVLATVTGIGIALLYTALGLRFPRQTLVQYSQLILGKIPGKTVELLFIWFALHLGALANIFFVVDGPVHHGPVNTICPRSI